MLIRIVKLTFEKESVTEFLQIFEAHHENIKKIKGFSSLELYQDQSNTNLFFTYSHWEDEIALENYRDSKYFRDIWSRIKILFADRPEAWSLKKS